jgi:hypothetical protein
MLHRMMNNLHKCSRVGLLSLLLSNTQSLNPTLLILTLTQASQRGRGERSKNGARIFWLQVEEGVWPERAVAEPDPKYRGGAICQLDYTQKYNEKNNIIL